MKFTVKSAKEAAEKETAFIKLFDSEPTNITIGGVFQDRAGELIFAFEDDPLARLHVGKFHRIWITVVLAGNLEKVKPTDKEFTLFLH